ncbi:hypothetical protein NC652_015394 [Populus alba x Populus x berolinensis]|nr:hypothetical protein NC652_015394 [Populus alba x Populus x berolinensis]
MKHFEIAGARMEFSLKEDLNESRPFLIDNQVETVKMNSRAWGSGTPAKKKYIYIYSSRDARILQCLDNGWRSKTEKRPRHASRQLSYGYTVPNSRSHGQRKRPSVYAFETVPNPEICSFPSIRMRDLPSLRLNLAPRLSSSARFRPHSGGC